MIAGQLTWYVTRGSGAVALLLLTVALVLGVPTASRGRARLIVQLLHRNASLLAVAFVAVHVATTVADSYVDIHLADAFVPFLADYRPLWLGLGAVATDVMLAVIVTSAFRSHLRYRTWRAVHLSAYACWPIAFVHGLQTGSDTGFGWMRWIDVACAAAVLGAAGWRLAGPRLPATARRVNALR